ncbi:MAG: c-type cytochrome, partial [Gammaproteobacteria bacterium]
MKRSYLFLSLLVFNPALADESSIKLKDGPGKDLVSSHCAMCHSLDYIPMQSAILDKPGWTKTVNKMIKIMGAPIKQEDVEPIVNYLA